jgi:flagellar basal-body rod protein FlgF
MLIRLQNSYSSMNDMVRQQERVANNLANAGTIGYRRDRTFTEVFNERLDAELAPVSERVATQWADPTSGAIESTGNPLDVAIAGEGFFVLSDPANDAQRYTRAGRFTLDAEGTLRDPSGFAVEGESGPIQVPPEGGDIEVRQDGEVRAGDQVIGKLRLVQFENPLQLRRLEGATFDANGMEPVDIEQPTLRQGYVEQSNVNPMQEMTDMITHFRLFESQQKSIQTQDSLLGAVTRDLGTF